MRIDYGTEREEGPVQSQSGPDTVETVGQPVKMTMADAMRKYKGRQGDELDALNYESESAMGGTLFERVTVPTNNP